MADYGVNINLRVKGQSGLDRLNAKVKQLTKSVDDIRQIDIINPRNTGGAGGKDARNELKKYRQDMDDVVKSVNKAKGAFGETANQQMAVSDSLEEYTNNLKIGTKRHKEALAATNKQNAAIGRETISINKNTDAQIKNNNAQAQGNKLDKFNNRSNKAALTSGAISGAFPLLFGQGPLGGAFGFAGGFAGTKIGGQMGGFAGGLVATAVLQQLTTAIKGLNDLGKALDPKTLNIDAVSKSFGLLGTDTERYLKLIEQTEGKQAAYNAAVKETTKLIGQDGVEALQAFADSSQNLTNEMSKFFTRIGTQIAKLFAKGADQETDKPIIGFERSNLLAQAKLEKEDKQIMDLVKQRENANRNVARQLEDQIVKLMKAKNIEDARKKAAELARMEYEQITKSLTDQITFLENAITLGSSEAQIIKEKTKLIEAAKKAGVKFDEAEIERQVRLKHELQKTQELYASIASTIETGLVDAIEGAINGTKTLGDVARSVFTQIQKSLIQAGVSSFLDNLPFKIPGRAEGGPVKGGRSFIVGERGPELFTPGASGMITPNHALGGSTNVVVNVDASGSNVEGDEQGGRELGLVLSAAIESELIKQKRPGGLLA